MSHSKVKDQGSAVIATEASQCASMHTQRPTGEDSGGGGGGSDLEELTLLEGVVVEMTNSRTTLSRSGRRKLAKLVDKIKLLKMKHKRINNLIPPNLRTLGLCSM